MGRRPQTGLKASDNFQYIPATAKNLTLTPKSKDIWWRARTEEKVSERPLGTQCKWPIGKREGREGGMNEGESREYALAPVYFPISLSLTTSNDLKFAHNHAVDMIHFVY